MRRPLWSLEGDIHSFLVAHGYGYGSGREPLITITCMFAERSPASGARRMKDESGASPPNALRPDDDRSLCERVTRGDSEAFEALVARHHALVFRVVRGVLGDWHQTEDVCQEVFATLFRKIADFRHDSSLGTWLYRVAVNAALKTRKRERGARAWLRSVFEERRSLGAGKHSVAGGPAGATFPERPSFEISEAFEKLVRPLPESLRTAVVLREAAGLSYEEISEVLGCSRGAVEQKLHRALVQLRKIWDKKHDAL